MATSLEEWEKLAAGEKLVGTADSMTNESTSAGESVSGEQENVSAGGESAIQAAGAASEAPVAQGSFSSAEENELAASPAPSSTPGNPQPDLRGSQEALFAPEMGSGGLPSRFPSPRSDVTRRTPDVYAGPTDTSSVASVYSPVRLNSRASVFAPEDPTRMSSTEGADYYRRRGGHMQPGFLDLMAVIPELPLPGNQIAAQDVAARRMESAIRHAALVFRRLTAADRGQEADELDAHFVQLFGVQYEEARVHAIMHEEDD